MFASIRSSAGIVFAGVLAAFLSAAPAAATAVRNPDTSPDASTVAATQQAPGAPTGLRLFSGTDPGAGIAALYPGDVGIEKDPRVVFVERFDEPSLSALFGRWTDILNGPRMLFSSDVPPGSPGVQSLDIPWVGGGMNTGGHLYKLMTPGVDDTLYIRYYIKYPLLNNYTHTGVWIGGYNPPLAWPNPQAGIKPTGTDRFSGSAEPSNARNRSDPKNSGMARLKRADGNNGVTCCSTIQTSRSRAASGCASST